MGAADAGSCDRRMRFIVFGVFIGPPVGTIPVAYSALPGGRKDMRSRKRLSPLGRWFADSPLEGNGFGLPVPRQNVQRFQGLRSARSITGALRKSKPPLGKPLVLDFAREFLPDDYDEVRHIFGRRGAYRRYKDLLVRRGVLERWYDFSNKAGEAALRGWCSENGIDLSGT